VDEIQSRLAELHLNDDQSLDAILARHYTGDAFAEARKLARIWIENYDAADPDRVSVAFLAREHKAEGLIDGDRAFRVVTGYDGIPQALQARVANSGGHLHLETMATAVQWTRDSVEVHACDPLGEARGPFTARRLVVAVPVGVLQALPGERAAIHFTPTIDKRDHAVRGLEMGHVVKLVFAFRKRFWEGQFPDELGFLLSTDGPFYSFWTGYPVYAPILVAWAGGPAADRLAGLDNEERVDRALDQLATLTHMHRAELNRQVVAWDTHDWAADPLARGAYSYVRVGGIEAQAALARPIEDTLFFAGEATELSGNQATVHGALLTGERAADEVLRSLGAAPSPP
jgi:monoamine oxidase